MKWAARIILIAGLWVSCYTNSHAQSNVQFSGQAIRSAPNDISRQMQLYVGDNQVRVEYRYGATDMVKIYDMANQRLLVLVPQQKIYMQRGLPSGRSVNPMLPPRDSNPCSVIPEGQCEKLGSENLFGRPVSKWEVTVDQQGKALHSLHWIDEERLMSLRDVWPDGSVSELTLQGTERRDERVTERWQRVTEHLDGTKDVTTQWYDPELRISVREERPGGLVREITRIRIAKQPEKLFQAPPDYRRVEENGQKPGTTE